MRYFLSKFKGTLITALIFILLICFIYFRDHESSTEVQSEVSLPFDILAEEVLSVEIYYPDSWILLEQNQEGSKWLIVDEDNKLNADEKLVQRLIEDIRSTEIIGTVPIDEVDLAQFGLENAKVEIVILTEEQDHRFIVGDNIQVGSGTYVNLPNEKQVLVVEKDYLRKYLNMSEVDFREKTLLDFDSAQVSRIQILSGNFSINIYKDDQGWFIDDDEETVADEKKVDDILWVFSRAKVLNFENENPEDLATYGFDEPAGEIRFYEDDEIHGVIFGKRKNEDSYYIKSDSGDTVYSIHKSLFKKIPKNIDQLSMR